MHDNWIQPILDQATAKGLNRAAVAYPQTGGRIMVEGRELLNFSSNDYLDLAHHPHVVECAQRALIQYGTGATASRLVTGTLPIHEELEARLAASKGCATALLFGSGYTANAGTIPALAGRGDTILADKLVHASMIDACRLSEAKLVRFRHNDPDALEQRLATLADAPGRKLVLIESVYSMDGDLAPLEEIARLTETYGAMLMIDEAHAAGIFGPHGAGRVRELGLERQTTVSMGTLSKAFAGSGGYIAGSEALRNLLVSTSRAFIYTTAPAPATVGAALGALDVLDATPTLGNVLRANADYFRGQLNAAGFDTLQSDSQIIPIVIGDNQQTLTAARRLRDAGILAAAIRPPTVPPGTARLRLSVTLAHTIDDLDRATETLARILRDPALR